MREGPGGEGWPEVGCPGGRGPQGGGWPGEGGNQLFVSGIYIAGNKIVSTIIDIET